MLKTYESNSSIQTGSTGPQADASAFNGGFDASAGRQFQNATQDMSDVLDRRRKEDDAVWANNAATQAQLHWQEYLDKAESDPDAGTPGFAGRMKDKFDRYTEETLSNAPTRSTQQYLQAHMNDLSEHVQGRALAFEAEQRMAARTNEIATAIDASTALAARANSFEEVDALANQQKSVVNGVSGLKPNQKAQLSNATKEIYRGYMISKGEQDPRGVLDDIEFGKFDGKVDGGWLAGQMAHLRAKADILDAMNEANGANARKNLSEYRQENGTTPNWYTAPNNPKLAAKDSTQAQYDYEIYHGRQFILNNNPTNTDIYIRSVAEAGKPAQAQHLAEFANKQYAELQKDSGGAAMTDPSVSKLYQDFQTGLATANGEQDPKKKLAALNSASQSRDKFIQQSLANQIARGVDPQDANPVPLNHALRYSTAINKALHDGNVDAVVQTLGQISNDWGKNDKDAIKLMQSESVPANLRLQGAGSIIALKKDTPEVSGYILSLKDRDKEGKNKPVEEFLKGKTIKDDDMVKAVAEDPTMKSLSMAMRASGTQDALASSYNKEIQDYAGYLMLHNQATKIKDAVALASSSIFKSEFATGEVNGVSFVIPRKDAKGTLDDADVQRTKYRANYALDQIINSKPGEFDIKQFAGISESMPSEQRHYEIMRRLADRGQWLNDGDGITLYWDRTGSGPGGLVSVKGNDKNPIHYSFYELAHTPWKGIGLDTGPSNAGRLENSNRSVFNPKKWLDRGADIHRIESDKSQSELLQDRNYPQLKLIRELQAKEKP